jgi:6-phosphogluconolactonase
MTAKLPGPNLQGLHGEVVVSDSPEQAADALAQRLGGHLKQRLRETDRIHLALSGGSSGTLLCASLAATEALAAGDWARVHVWMVDERCVPDNDPRLNFALVREQLAPKVGLPGANLHPMPVLRVDGAEVYQEQLDAALAAHGGRLDAAVLGMGPDGHTASLFPHSPALAEQTRRVAVNDGETVTPPRPRMTLTFPVLNQARLIALLVPGASKRPALVALASGSADPRDLPVAGLSPSPDSELLWYLDRASTP